MSLFFSRLYDEGLQTLRVSQHSSDGRVQNILQKLITLRYRISKRRLRRALEANRSSTSVVTSPSQSAEGLGILLLFPPV
jgi:hypothetical protein